MINVVVVTHGDFGEALIRAAEMIVGPQENVRAVALLPEESPQRFLTQSVTSQCRGHHRHEHGHGD
jgi:mannose/fructose-specific phosphotransferase system component IIA